MKPTTRDAVDLSPIISVLEEQLCKLDLADQPVAAAELDATICRLRGDMHDQANPMENPAAQ